MNTFCTGYERYIIAMCESYEKGRAVRQKSIKKKKVL